jgi:NTE family protein
LRQLVFDLLDKKGIRTFGDLKLSHPESDDIKDIYKLVVVATDVTRAKVIRLPWDYSDYGLDADTQLVADAIRASASIPFYYEPIRLGESYVVDGGITADFPIWVFKSERRHHSQDRPTIGIKLSAKETSNIMQPMNEITNTFTYTFAVLDLVLNAQDQSLERPMYGETNDIR